ncbi:hypothetical protein HPB50_024561 [Hyalomma asiaticum]|uniref:Uncharacterized protein n=1 Tax=Hyalomma asiaticum TaxID=266040 RepID=A0ACB7TN81_HYAAI|nr:hypothetical protein HPB50_024561 [Hyalomma asiaticum]
MYTIGSEQQCIGAPPAFEDGKHSRLWQRPSISVFDKRRGEPERLQLQVSPPRRCSVVDRSLTLSAHFPWRPPWLRSDSLDSGPSSSPLPCAWERSPSRSHESQLG